MRRFYPLSLPISANTTRAIWWANGCSSPPTPKRCKPSFPALAWTEYGEFFITDYESAIPGLHRYLGEYESIDELNYLAAMVEELDDVATFEAALQYSNRAGRRVWVIWLISKVKVMNAR